MKKLRWTNVVTLLAAPNAVVAVCPWLGPAHWTMDLLACFVVQATGMLALAAIALSIGRKWVLASIFAAFGAIGASAILPDWLGMDNFPTAVENAPRLRVLSLNLLKSNDKGYEHALAVVRNAEADVIWLGEYTPSWQKYLQATLSDYPYRLERPDLGSFGAAMYSRHPFAVAEMVPGGHDWAPFGRTVVHTPHGPIGVLGVHPPPPMPSAARIAERDAGLAAIPLILENLPERRIVLGDFNATPWNAAFVKMREQTGLGPGSTRWWLPSWPDPLPAPLRVPIDHVLVSGDLVVEHAELGASFGSDHRPLLATVRIGG